MGDGQNSVDLLVPTQILSGAQTNPRLLTLNLGTGGASVSGAGKQDFNAVAPVSATPSPGYVFASWTGDFISANTNASVTMNANKEVNATFVPDTADSDGDGLTNYQESVTYSTDPNDSDSDDDSLDDSLEVQIGLDPSTANANLVTFFTNRESTARSEGNTSGIAYVQANYSKYNLYTEAEKNASSTIQYNLGKSVGISEGNASGIALVQANPNSYFLFTTADKNASVESAATAGKTTGLATVENELGTKGFSALTYLDQLGGPKPYTNEWFYQPGMGWMWTSESVFPFVYQFKVGESQGAWLYFGQLTDQVQASFYDYGTKTWITPEK